ncbi:unnamed protein product, partial [Candidula unifasciata]
MAHHPAVEDIKQEPDDEETDDSDVYTGDLSASCEVADSQDTTQCEDQTQPGSGMRLE